MLSRELERLRQQGHVQVSMNSWMGKLGSHFTCSQHLADRIRESAYKLPEHLCALRLHGIAVKQCCQGSQQKRSALDVYRVSNDCPQGFSLPSQLAAHLLASKAAVLVQQQTPEGIHAKATHSPMSLWWN